MTEDYTNEDLRAFIRRLDESSHEVTDWEAKFIESVLSQEHPIPFTPRQRDSIKQMILRYGEDPK